MLALLIAGPALAQAQTTWTGGGLTSLWSDPFNWSAGAPVGGDATAITFAGGLKLNPAQDLGFPFVLNSLSFDANAGAFSLVGAPLRFAGTATLAQNSNVAMTISNQILIDSRLTYSGSGPATFAGGLTRFGLTADGTSLVKTGSGVLTLATATGFDGRVDIQQGRVRLGNAAALQSARVSIQTDGGLDLNGHAAVPLGSLSGTGSLDLGDTHLTVGQNNASPGAYSGTITGTAAPTSRLTKVGTGTMTLSGTGSRFDQLSVQDGLLALTGGSLTTTNAGQGLNVGVAQMNVTGGAVLTTTRGSSVIDGFDLFRGTNAIVGVSGIGSQLLNGGALLVGTTTLGRLVVSDQGHVAADLLFVGGTAGSFGRVDIAFGGTLATQGAVLGTLAGSRGLVHVAGAGARWSTNTLALGQDTVAELPDPGGSVLVEEGGAVDVRDATTFNDALSRIVVAGASFGTGALVSHSGRGLVSLDDSLGDAVLTINGASGTASYTGAIDGTGRLVKTGASVQGLAKALNFSGSTTITGGQIRLEHAMALRNSAVTIDATNGLDLNGHAQVTLAGLSGAGSFQLGATHLTVDDQGRSPAAYSGAIDGSAGKLTKTGAGTLTFAGNGNTLRSLLVRSGSVAVVAGSVDLAQSGGVLEIGGVGPTPTTAILDITAGGRVVVAGTTTVDGSNGTAARVTGPGSLLRSFVLDVGVTATGRLETVNGGRVVADQLLTLGNNPGSSGRIDMASGSLLEAVVVRLGGAAGSQGVASLRGAGTRFSALSLNLGGAGSFLNGGEGRLDVEDGAQAEVSGGTHFWSRDTSLAVSRGTFTTGFLAGTGSFGRILLQGDPAAGPALTIHAPSSSNTYAGTIGGSGSLLKTGGSTQILAGANTFSGSVEVRDGTLEMATSAASAYRVSGGRLQLATGNLGAASVRVENGGTLAIAGGDLVLNATQAIVGGGQRPGSTIALAPDAHLRLNNALLINNGIVDGAVDIGAGAFAKGQGIYLAVNVGDGGTFSPGNSPGSVVTGPATWGAGGTYRVELAAASGTAGTQWDLWIVDGTLDVTAGSAGTGRFTISLATLDGADQPAALADFAPGHSYRWQIVDTSGGLNGFDPAKIVLDTTAFANTLAGGHFQLALSEGDLFVDFVPAPVPEPHEWALMLAGLGCVAVMVRRRHGARAC